MASKSSLNFLTSSFIIFLLFSSFFVTNNARPIAAAANPLIAYVDGSFDNTFDSLIMQIRAIKRGGSSLGGNGHKFIDEASKVGLERSGPSPAGVGHKFIDEASKVGLERSGPSPAGVGHKFIDEASKVKLERSDPSPAGVVH